MQNTLTTSAKATAPWRRTGNVNQSQTLSESESAKASTFSTSFSADAQEFVPSMNTQAPEFIPSFNAQAAEFVPSFMTVAAMQPCTTAPTPQAVNACSFLCLDGYSDDSDDDSAGYFEKQRRSAGDTHEPRPISAVEAQPGKSSPVPSESGSSAKQLRPWRAAKEKTCRSEQGEESPQLQSALSSSTVDTQASGGSQISTTSDLSEHESETDDDKLSQTPPSDDSQEELVDDQSYNFTVQGLLKLRHTVSWMEGIEDHLSAAEVSPRTASKVDAAGESKKPTAEKSAGEKPAVEKCAAEKPRVIKKPAEKSWRDRDTRDRAHTCPGEAFAAVRSEASRSAKLKTSDDSWAARQKMRRSSCQDGEKDERSDEEIVRTMKSILNKITIEKFPVLSRQLATCGIRTTSHLEILIHEVFEKATTQHHFINMYADLCEVLHSHFSESSATDGQKMNFKKVLLNACQASFERHLTPPTGLDKLDEEEQVLAEQRYKMRMLGNIRFVGALLVRKMLATKVMFAIIEELLSDPTPEALESLASLLSVVGSTFDVPEWPHRALLNAAFIRIEGFVKEKTIKARVRCLLKDVLDLRENHWEDRKPKQLEAPSTLEEVAQKAAAEEADSPSRSNQGGNYNSLQRLSMKIPPSDGCGKTSPSNGYGGKVSPSQWSNGHGGSGNITRLAGDLFGSPSKSGSPKDAKGEDISASEDSVRPSEHPKKRNEKASEERFDKQACRKELAGALKELRMSHDVKEAVTRTAGLAVPLSQQTEELCEILAKVAEEGSEEVRRIGFRFVAGLFTEGHWKPGALGKGIQQFIDGICCDLKFDIPSLPKIVHEELYPTFTPLVKSGLLQPAHHEHLMTEF